MFGRAFWGAHFYGPRYWGDGGDQAPVVLEQPSRGGIWPSHEPVEHTRERAWKAAREAKQELRRALERAFEDEPEQTATIEPEVRRSIVAAEESLASIPAADFGGMADAVGKLRQELLQFIAADQLQRAEIEHAVQQAQWLQALLLDDDDALIAILAAG